MMQASTEHKYKDDATKKERKKETVQIKKRETL